MLKRSLLLTKSIIDLLCSVCCIYMNNLWINNLM